LSEVERVTEERNISRKELAKLVSTSPSFITRPFQGNKIASLEFLSKVEKALDIQFNIIASSLNTKIGNKKAQTL